MPPALSIRSSSSTGLRKPASIPTSVAAAPITRPPFYAVRLYPGDIGAATGLVTNENASVLKQDGTIIDRLYACGNDMNSVMGGNYPGPGITIGPGIVFAYVAVQDIARRLGERRDNHA